MNTKQIWQSLALNKYTTEYFDGVFSIDNLIEIKTKPKLIICNTDPSNKPGKHWVGFFFQNDTVDFYDSTGNSIEKYGNLFLNFIKRFVKYYRESSIRTQPINTSTCGEYCLYFSYYRCRGFSLKQIISKMIFLKDISNFVCKKFQYCKKSKCSIAQNCIKQ